MIIDNNIENEKNKVQWEESAYQISIKSNKNWQSYKGPKFAKNGRKYEKNVKNCCFCLVTFLSFKIHDNIKKIKNSAWCKATTYQISSKNIENWQSY